MSATLQHECTRVPVTALSSCGPFFVAAEGPFLRFYTRQDHIYLSSRRAFQTQAIHGIAVLSTANQCITLVVWGGVLVRVLELSVPADGNENTLLHETQFSNVAKAPDWILDLSPLPFDLGDGAGGDVGTCAAVTAHNALLELTVRRVVEEDVSQSQLVVSISELTSSSRSILYSAHVLWESKNRLLVAAGTAFGEIMYWSWTRRLGAKPISHVHRVFLGHEGSIFGVRISDELDLVPDQGRKRLLASCSDDRTIRVWDISKGVSDEEGTLAETEDPEVNRTRHTGFSNASFDMEMASTDCLAIGWGHLSRVWTVQFLDPKNLSDGVCLLSAGEDATSRTWSLVSSSDEESVTAGVLPYKLLQVNSASSHNGKNLWSLAVHEHSSGLQQAISGGADSKITAHCLGLPGALRLNGDSVISQSTVHDIASLKDGTTGAASLSQPTRSHKSSSKAEFYRSYTFIDDDTFLLTTNSGKIFLQERSREYHSSQANDTPHSVFVEQLGDLTGYSICTGIPALGAAFVAGSRGSVYYYQKDAKSLMKIHTFNGKVGELFVANQRSSDARKLVLLVSLVGQNVAQLLHLDLTENNAPAISALIPVPLSEESTGLAMTSMEYVFGTSQDDYLLLGFRRGAVAQYRIASTEQEGAKTVSASLDQTFERVHGKEAVTSVKWVPSQSSSATGNLVSTGRDGCLIVHALDLSTNAIQLVHSLTLPVGPNVEGIHPSNGNLLVYGFTSKRLVLYDTATEEELMSVDTGGAHRSWTFQPSSKNHGGGTLVWTRASSMHVCHQVGPNHQVIRPGGHGREIKAVAISNPSIDNAHKRLIATGAEDTDIKIFEYTDGEIVCRRTLRKHTTGIQHLQWSDDGVYLFSSGGCEEFYIWRIRALPNELGSIGIVCESVYQPESEHSDLRIMSFDVWRRGAGFVIAMVFSNSVIKLYSYEPSAAEPWPPLAKGVYFTSCLTQCVFLSTCTILTAGTDGHAVSWPLGVLSQQQGCPTQSSTHHLTWKQPLRIHQSSSKTLATHTVDAETTLIVSGGDDGSLALLVTTSNHQSTGHPIPPVIVARTHASAVTACAILSNGPRIFVLTSGNDQWVRLWEVTLHLDNWASRDGDPLSVRCVRKVKTSVADVSSMAVLGQSGDGVARVLICGVGMEVVRVEWEKVSCRDAVVSLCLR